MEEQNGNNENSELDVDEQYVISVNKFILLSVLTFGLYEIWWTYKVWRFFQQKEKLDIMPAARALLGIVFLIPMFNKIKRTATDKGYTKNYNSVLLFFCYLIVGLLAEIGDEFLFISVFSVIFLVPPFKAFNYARLNSPEFIVKQQDSFNGKQTFLIVIGILWWILVLFAILQQA